MTTFQEFIARHPDLTPFARTVFAQIDKQAEKAGAQLAAIGDIARLLAADHSLSLSLRHTNQIMADALERDPSGRLAAIPSLRHGRNGREGWEILGSGGGQICTASISIISSNPHRSQRSEP